MRRRFLCLFLCSLLFLASCQSNSIPDTVTEPTVFFSQTDLAEKRGKTLLYEATGSLPVLRLPAGREEEAKRVNERLEKILGDLLACPFDLNALEQKAQREDFTPYDRTVTAEVSHLEDYLSILFLIETRGGGISSDYERVGFTIEIASGEVVPITAFLAEDEAKEKIVSAFSSDLAARPELYDAPDGITPDMVDLSCFVLADEAVHVWLPNGLASVSISPLLAIKLD